MTKESRYIQPTISIENNCCLDTPDKDSSNSDNGYTDLSSASFFLLQLTYQNTDISKAQKRKIKQFISLVYNSAFANEEKARTETKDAFRRKMYKYRDITRNLLLNFLHSYSLSVPVSIPKGYNYWHALHTTNPANPSPRHFLYTFNRLVEKGYIDKVANHWNNPNVVEKRTGNKTAKYIPSKKLVKHINDFFATKESIERCITLEKKECSPIQIRKGDTIYHKTKEELDADGLSRIKSSYRWIEKYNDFMKKFDVTFDVSEQYFDYITISRHESLNNLLYSKILEKHHSKDGFTFRINHRDVFRRFVGDFKKGGRFYGCPVQYIPSDLREYLKINGNPTVEEDFEHLHPTMLYMMNGAINQGKRPNNPYYYCKYREPEKRKEAKLALLIMINSKDRKEAVMALRKRFVDKLKYQKGDYKLKDKYINELFTILENHNAPIKEFFYSNKGIELQYYDSIMAYNIMRRFYSCREPKPIFCIHDSFVVRARDGYFLKKLMENELAKFYRRCQRTLNSKKYQKEQAKKAKAASIHNSIQ